MSWVDFKKGGKVILLPGGEGGQGVEGGRGKNRWKGRRKKGKKVPVRIGGVRRKRKVFGKETPRGPGGRFDCSRLPERKDDSGKKERGGDRF